MTKVYYRCRIPPDEAIEAIRAFEAVHPPRVRVVGRDLNGWLIVDTREEGLRETLEAHFGAIID